MIPANTALAIMVRGVTKIWEQPFAYYFTSNACKAAELRDIIIKTIIEMLTAGFNVKAVVSDMGSNILQVSYQLGISQKKTYYKVTTVK